jgi:hypothetical protein
MPGKKIRFVVLEKHRISPRADFHAFKADTVMRQVTTKSGQKLN